MIYVHAGNAGERSPHCFSFCVQQTMNDIRKGGSMIRNNKPITEMTRRYGHTVYTIRAYCDPESKATYEEKLLTLIRHEADKQDEDDAKQQNSEASA